MTIPVRPCIVAHINFPHAIHRFQDLRHVQQLFATRVLATELGRLVSWKDYRSTAGFKHHMGRSMAVFELKTDDYDSHKVKSQVESLQSELGRIVGVVTPSGLSDLLNGKTSEISVDMNGQGHSQVIATLKDPFFKAMNHSVALKTRLSWSDCIPMVVKTQELLPSTHNNYH